MTGFVKKTARGDGREPAGYAELLAGGALPPGALVAADRHEPPTLA